MERLRRFGIRIQVVPGASAQKLLEALQDMARGGRYRIDASKGVRHSSVNTAASMEWIEIGLDATTVNAHQEQLSMNGNLTEFLKSSTLDQQNRLRISGIDASLSSAGNASHKLQNRKFIRRFVVQVFHLQATSIAPLGALGLSQLQFREEEGRGSLLDRRLEKIAVRTLYTLNLQMGEVTIRAGEDSRFTVERVSPMPDFRGEELAERAAKAVFNTVLELYRQRGAVKEQQTLLGMDPEFLLFNRATGRVIPASRYLELTGEAGCDSIRYRGERRFPLVELRPQPGGEPREVLVHLLRAFRRAYQSIGDKALQWQAGGMPQRGFPLGGHLHFSGIPLTFRLLQVLDNYLALPVAVLEDQRGSKRRPRYGYLGDFRLQGHGGFEYRTLPSFLISPLVTKGVVAIAALIAGHEEQLKRRPLLDDEMYNAFYKGDQNQLREVLPELYADLTSLAAYSKYESYIAPFIEATCSGRTWDETTDIRRPWKLENHS